MPWIIFVFGVKKLFNKVYEIVWRIQVSPFLLLSEATFASSRLDGGLHAES